MKIIENIIAAYIEQQDEHPQKDNFKVNEERSAFAETPDLTLKQKSTGYNR